MTVESHTRGAPRAPDAAGVDPSRAWYAVYTRARHERTVQLSIAGKGYPVFLPSYRVCRRRANRSIDRDLPLFPSYVFCQFDPLVRLPILQTPGVVFVVGRGCGPQPVDDTEIAVIRRIVNSGVALLPWAFLEGARRIRVRAGPLTGVEGRFLRVKNQQFLVASITLLQRSVIAEIEQDQVEPI